MSPIGINCATPILECNSNPCQNGATCNGDHQTYSCTCTPEWTGANCLVVMDACDPDPCQNGGICSGDHSTYTCTCQTLNGSPTHSGNNCQTTVSACDPNPCQNGGTCTGDHQTYTCSCPSTYGGQNCEIGCVQSELETTFASLGFQAIRCTTDGSVCFSAYRQLQLTWSDALAKCQEFSPYMNLAHIYNQAEFNIVHGLSTGPTEQLWLGGYTDGHASNPKNTVWKWAAGNERITQFWWNGNEPNNHKGRGENCMQSWGNWNDKQCGTTINFVCQFRCGT